MKTIKRNEDDLRVIKEKKMNLKLITQKQDYDNLVEKYREVEKIVAKRLSEELNNSNVKVMQMPHRIKSWASLEEKWAKKGDKYLSLGDLTDLLGFRIICYFSSQVDEAADVIRSLFEVDKMRSCDKRIMISPDTFGYVSLHIICSLKDDGSVPHELSGLKFEIQLRSTLQHAWAEIEHDLGYKTALEIPWDMRREFSRVAGLLEIADESFDNIRKKLLGYEKEAVERIRTDTADDMTLDIHTLNAYMKYSSAMENLFSRMAAVTGGNILLVGAEGYLQLLGIMDINTLGDLYDLVNKESDHVITLLERALEYSDLESITTNSALFYLCRARLIWGDYSEKDINNVYYMLTGDQDSADKSTKIIMGIRKSMDIGA